MTKILITKNTVANKRVVKIGDIVDVDPADAKFLVYIKKATYVYEEPKKQTLTTKDIPLETKNEALAQSLEAPKKKRGRPFKNAKHS